MCSCFEFYSDIQIPIFSSRSLSSLLSRSKDEDWTAEATGLMAKAQAVLESVSLPSAVVIIDRILTYQISSS